jgi:hypothetical protein
MTQILGLLLTFALSAAPDAGAPVTSRLRPAPKASGAKPVLAMMELNPWLMVIGSDSATFVLYEDGRVVYRSHAADGSPGDYFAVALKEAEQKALLAELDLARLGSLPQHTNASNSTDMPTTALITFPAGKARAVSVYGVIDADQSHQVIATTTVAGSPAPPAVPPAFTDIYRRLHGFSRTNATPWTPEVIEVMVWDYNYAPSTRPWPKGWPDLGSAAEKLSADAVGRVFVDGRDKEALMEFLHSLGEREAVLMNGKKMAISARIVLPGEQIWERAIPPSH